MIINTRDLTGKGLDWAVAEAISLPMKSHDEVQYPDAVEWIAERDGTINHYVEDENNNSMSRRYDKTPFSPSVDWSQCGPLIQEYKVCFAIYPNEYFATTAHNDFDGCAHGENHLIAACRAIVAAKLGRVVAIPDGLCDVREEAKL